MITEYQPYVMQDVRDSSARQRFKVISTFAGGGGSSLGYRLAGGKVLCVNEFVEEAIKTYTHNFPDTLVIPGDIKELKGKDLMDPVGMKPGKVDILDGSPPCSAFSLAGKRHKNWNKTKLYSDGKKVENIEDLFLEFIRIAKDIQPKVIIAENVRGLTIGRAVSKLNEFINEFKMVPPGYLVTYDVLSAKDYGVAQERPRTFFICIRQDVADAVGLHMLNLAHEVIPNPTSRHITMASALSDVALDMGEVQMLKDYVQNNSENQRHWLSILPKNPDKRVNPCSPEIPTELNPDENYFTLIRTCANMPSPTLTANGSKRSGAGLFHWAEDRKFTIKELKRLQGLPEDYELTGSFDQQAERIGRMVAPKVMAEIANRVYERVLKPYREITS
jgi:DNA (cytosine-5)-methyltransferase 1